MSASSASVHTDHVLPAAPASSRAAADWAPVPAAGSFSQRGRVPRSTSLLLIAPLALLLGWTFFLPIATLLFQSISKPAWTLEHYARLAYEPLYIRIILRTVWISFATTAITLLLGYPIAVLMARLKGWVAGLVAACVLIPLWTSVLVRSYAWIVLLQRNGIINNALREWGLIDQPLTLLYTEGAVLMAMSHVLLPFMILPIYSTLKNISPDLTKAALNLGASQARAFLAVTLPLSLPGVFAGCLMVFVLALGFYITPALVGGPRTLMIATLISQQATEFLNWPFAGAISLVLLALSLGVTIAFKRLLGVERMVAHD
jgi:mannopine transport system permease protein